MNNVTTNDAIKEGTKKPRAKKLSTHIDMTPMVDLACLLITFFMLTTAMTKSRALEIVIPDDPLPGEPRPPVAEKRAMHILLTENDRIFWYMGKDNNKEKPKLIESGFSDHGIRKILLEKNIEVMQKIEELNLKISQSKFKYSEEAVSKAIRNIKSGDLIGPVVFIKSDNKVKYKNIVDIIDEMAITNIARYTLADMSGTEKDLLAEHKIKKQSSAR